MKKGIAVAILLFCLGFLLASCQTKTTEKEEKAKETSEATKTYKIGQAFTLNNIQWKVISVKKLDEIPKKIKDIGSKEPSSYKPAKGAFLVVNFKFKGSAKNEPAGYNIDVIKVIDKDSKEYKNIEPSGTIDDYRMQTNIPNLSFALNNNAEEKEYMEIYDIPKTAKDLKLIWMGFGKAQQVVRKIEVDLAL